MRIRDAQGLAESIWARFARERPAFAQDSAAAGHLRAVIVSEVGQWVAWLEVSRAGQARATRRAA